jgi:hypothetical protein
MSMVSGMEVLWLVFESIGFVFVGNRDPVMFEHLFNENRTIGSDCKTVRAVQALSEFLLLFYVAMNVNSRAAKSSNAPKGNIDPNGNAV